MITYRHQEILQALAANPNGLTTAQIYKITSADTGTEIPNVNICSQLIYGLRNAKDKLITTSDAAGGKIHKITGAGRVALAEAIGSEPPVNTIDRTGDKLSDDEINQLTDADTNNNQAHGWTLYLSKDDPLEAAFANLIIQLRQITPAPTIERKQEVTALLETLENQPFIKGESRALINNARQAIEQLEDAA